MLENIRDRRQKAEDGGVAAVYAPHLRGSIAYLKTGVLSIFCFWPSAPAAVLDGLEAVLLMPHDYTSLKILHDAGEFAEIQPCARHCRHPPGRNHARTHRGDAVRLDPQHQLQRAAAAVLAGEGEERMVGEAILFSQGCPLY